jgi:hypothetical protein
VLGIIMVSLRSNWGIWTKENGTNHRSQHPAFLLRASKALKFSLIVIKYLP